MLSLKAGALAFALLFSLSGVDSCDGKKSGGAQGSNQSGNASAPVNSQPEKPDGGVAKDDIKQLAQGQQSSISNAFVVVARDAETYKGLRKVVTNLPEPDKNFFESNVVVAAFLGERRTGGYSVRFTPTLDGNIRVEETTPSRDSISAQVITYPFAVVAVPVRNRQPVTVEVGNAFLAMMRPYQVRDGEFTMAGGIAGRSEKFGIAGSIGVMREGNLATFFFELKSRGGAKQRTLSDVASSLVQSDGRIAIGNLSPGSFVDMPADAIHATGSFNANENELSLAFEPIPGTIADGYNGRGSLNAYATAPAPKKKKASSEDNPQ